ncbi:glycosyltransferase family 2 protein [Candidatus Poribacteria bacterium]|nr:glycosyltransferase family 2 protein [Candidatus Poribacteria bacterium]
MLISVIIPAFNEEQTLEQVVRAVSSLPIETQIIVVNDGSTDGTYKVLEELRATYELSVVHCQENRGKGFAIRRGLQHVKGEVIVIQDADMELDPTDLSEVVKPLKKENVQVVYGSRFLEGRGNASLHNFIANRILATYTNLLYGCQITDESTGYKAFSAELITRLDLTCEGFEFCPEVTAKILRAGYRIYEVPVSYFPRTKKQGKKLRFWSDGFFAAWTLLKYRFISETELFK